MISQADLEMLTPEEKLLLVKAIWASLALKQEDVPVSPAEASLLKERWARNTQNRGSALTIGELKRRASGDE